MSCVLTALELLWCFLRQNTNATSASCLQLTDARGSTSATSCCAFFFCLETSEDLCSPNMVARIFKHFHGICIPPRRLSRSWSWRRCACLCYLLLSFQQHVSASRRCPRTSPSSCTPADPRAFRKVSSSPTAT